MKLIYTVLLIILFTACAKNNPKKSILGQWKVVGIDSKQIKDNSPQIWKDFKNDLYYFQNITFYKDSIFFIDYINSQPKLGTYYIVPHKISEDVNSIYTHHFPLENTTQSHKFNFFLARYDIKKFTRNKLVVTTDYLPGNDTFYKQLTITLKKNGDFE